MRVVDNIILNVVRAVEALYSHELPTQQIQIQKTKKEFEGYLTLVVFPLLKVTKKSPEQSAEEIGKWLLDNSEVTSSYNVVKGFLNLSIKDKVWLAQFNIWAKNENFGKSASSTGKTFMVEYSSPNTNKPLHLGHLRNNFLGYSVAEILKANGHEVYKTQIINDRGIHICKSMLAWQIFGNNETPESTGMKGDHLIGKYYVAFDKEYKKQIAVLVEDGMDSKDAEREAKIFKDAQAMLLKWEARDPDVYALWETMNAWVYEGFEATYKEMGVDFDKLYYESNTYILGKDVVEKGLADNHFYKKEDGSVWCDLSSHKMDDKLLLRADGTSVYMTQDLGTAIERFKDYPNLSGLIYTVGNEQNHHFNVLFTILKKIGYSWAEGCYHLSYGMVDLPTGRMKSREGTVVDADELMKSVIEDAKEMTQERGHLDGLSDSTKDELYKTIGLGGLKYYLLKVDPKKGMQFNPEESVDLNGNTGPFIQYTYARIQSILRKVETFSKVSETDLLLEPVEKTLLKDLSEFPSAIEEAGKSYSPAIIANYTYELVKNYNSFYQSLSIIKEQDANKKAFRIALSYKVGTVIKLSMTLLGVNVPERM
ncbi:MAG: arginine--tRNA ligase [Flavobacteriales bacterium]|nr:arginine--tRNA ligase [Flavobacteriales bacterium]